MDASTYQITEKISKFYQEVYDVYLPLVEDGCGREVLEDELSHFLDYLLDFPSCIKFYIEAYREMWEDEPLEFEGVKKQAGANAFTMSPKKWIEATDAVGIVSKSGRYGGTYAHSDIAMSFATWISPEFQLYIMKDYRRLKTDENSRLMEE